ncbi:MAG: hypothetical protein H0X24_15145 [Ktedonobacterales bacterium]|nr:hypothetical protein [Ktedonobacterales bacterium]
MGFFAGELEVVLQEHNPLPNESPWNVLNRLNVHPQQTERLQKAAEDIGQVATLPPPLLLQLKQELNLSPIAWARLQAGVEADAFFRLLMYHNYSLEEAVNKANAVFASALKDKLATGGKSESIYPSSPELDALAGMPSPVRRRGRMRKADKEALLAKQREQELAAQAEADTFQTVAQQGQDDATLAENTGPRATKRAAAKH